MALLAMSVMMPALADYWVVGSFQQEGNARAAARDYSSRTNESVMVSRHQVDGRTTYRLLVEKQGDQASQRAALERLGVTPWTFYGNDVDLVAESQSTPGRFFLVLGVFSSAARALDVARRRDANLRVSEEGNLVRVVRGPFDFKDPNEVAQARADGIEGAWWLDASDSGSVPKAVAEAEPEPAAPEPESESEPEPEPEPAAEQEVAMAPDPAPAAEPAPAPISPPRMNESYFDYCVKRANARERQIFCANRDFASTVVRERKVRAGMGGDVLLEFCARDATPAQRERYCDDATVQSRLTR